MHIDTLRRGLRFTAALLILAGLGACGGGGSDQLVVAAPPAPAAPVAAPGGAIPPVTGPTPPVGTAVPATVTIPTPTPATPSGTPSAPTPTAPPFTPLTVPPPSLPPTATPSVVTPTAPPQQTPSGAFGGTASGTVTASILSPGRNATEFILAADKHPKGVALVTRVFLPDGTAPTDAGAAFPVAFGYHGSGGLHVEPAMAGDTCTQTMETTYAQMTTHLLSQGVAVVWIDSFFSRDPRFCEDNDPAFKAFAPPVMDSGLQQVLSRVYDTVAAETAFCTLPRFDCGHMMRIGTSEGGTAVLVPSHRFLDHSLAQLFVPAGFGNKLAQLPVLTYSPLPANRPVPKFVMAISPGCGFFTAIPLSAAGLTQDLFYPAQDTYIEIGTADSIPDECAVAVGQGRRELQALEVKSREAIADPAYRYRPTLYPGRPHALWPAERPALEAKLTTLIQQYLK